MKGILSTVRYHDSENFQSIHILLHWINGSLLENIEYNKGLYKIAIT